MKYFANETRREKRIESKLEKLEKKPRRLWDVMR
jgi:hypothetical protein